MPGDLLTVSVDARDRVTVLILAGEVDAFSVGELDSALARAAQRQLPVIVVSVLVMMVIVNVTVMFLSMNVHMIVAVRVGDTVSVGARVSRRSPEALPALVEQ